MRIPLIKSAFLTVIMLTSCNKDEVIEIFPPDEPTFGKVKVWEYKPAPGQFINETGSSGGMSGDINTMERAVAWAQKRIDDHLFVSLGAFGGYIVVGFDHSIEARGDDYDFYVGGNAFLKKADASNEPGIVWVMQDANGNGLPDDQWYELAGSDTFHANTKRNYSVTYFRPDSPGKDTPWKASDGTEGVVKYMAAFHTQDFYYPAWINEDTYTLTGTLLSSRNFLDESTGFWSNSSFGWGYADNIGSDNLPKTETTGNIQRTGFKIANAINADGKRVSLKSIDFVKVQTGVMAFSGALGEVSTEVCGFGEYIK